MSTVEMRSPLEAFPKVLIAIQSRDRQGTQEERGWIIKANKDTEDTDAGDAAEQTKYRSLYLQTEIPITHRTHHTVK